MGFNNDGAEVVARRLAARQRGAGSRQEGSTSFLGAPSWASTSARPRSCPRTRRPATTRSRPACSPRTPTTSSSTSPRPTPPACATCRRSRSSSRSWRAVRRRADEARPDHRVPLLVKIAPDLSDDDVLAVADLAAGHRARRRSSPPTRPSAATGSPRRRPRRRADRRRRPERAPAHPAVARTSYALLRDRVGPDLTLIGVGGITTVDDARRRLAAGADLLQGYTAFVYEGPLWPRRIVRGLARMADERGPVHSSVHPSVHVDGEVVADQARRRLPPPDPDRAGRPRAVPGGQLRRGHASPGHVARRALWVHRVRASSAFGPTLDVVVEPRGSGTELARRAAGRRAGSRSPARSGRPFALPKDAVSLPARRGGLRRGTALPARRAAPRARLRGLARRLRARRGAPALRPGGAALGPLGHRPHRRRLRRPARRPSPTTSTTSSAAATPTSSTPPARTAVLRSAAAAAERAGAWSQVAVETPTPCGTGLCHGLPAARHRRGRRRPRRPGLRRGPGRAGRPDPVGRAAGRPGARR